MSLVVRKCKAAEIFDAPEHESLFAEYDAECSNPVIGSIAPQRPLYEMLEELGAAQCFAVYEGEVLCGFACVLTGPIPHSGAKLATAESLFVAAAFRHLGGWAMLRRVVQEHARAQGCPALFYSAPVGSRLARLLVHEDDCYLTNQIFTQRLS